MFIKYCDWSFVAQIFDNLKFLFKRYKIVCRVSESFYPFDYSKTDFMYEMPCFKSTSYIFDQPYFLYRTITFF